jgi:excisionase family DNA binding protein
MSPSEKPLLRRIEIQHTESLKLFEKERTERNRPEWLTTEEAATFLRVTVGSLRNMTSNGQVRAYKLGRRNRYLMDELNELLFSSKKGVSK